MEIRTEDIQLAEMSDEARVALLKEMGGTRVLTITLSDVSFHLLIREIENVEDRPTIFKFVSECVLALSGNIEKMVIFDIDSRSGMYRSYVTVRDARDDRTYNLDLHVTSALTLAVASKCPIFVTEEVFEKSSKEVKKYMENTVQRNFENIDPEKLTKH